MENKSVIEQAKLEINKMTELLYQQNTQEALLLMNGILDNLLKISEIIMPIQDIEESDKKKVIEVLGTAMKAMEEKDYVMLADVLNYDMIELLDNFREKM